jgi:predicted nucleotidyltransferase
MVGSVPLEIPTERLAEICRRYHVRELSLFGSVLRDDFHDDSDIDVLVEFETGAPIGLIEYVRLQHELAALVGRDVDLVEKPALKRYLRDRVLGDAWVVYAVR